MKTLTFDQGFFVPIYLNFGATQHIVNRPAKNQPCNPQLAAVLRDVDLKKTKP